MLQCNINRAILTPGTKSAGRPMFFFFPFNTESQSSSSAKTLPLLPFLPAPASARTNPRRTERAGDIGDFAVDFLRQTIVAFTSSLTALGNAANALFAQTTAVLATDRVARDAVGFLNGNWFNFGAQKNPMSPFGPYRQMQDPMSFFPFLTQGFSPTAFNPWAAFSEGMNFWANMWMPAAPRRNPFGNAPGATPFAAKVSAPNGFTWGFSWGA
jgi:hypothetical protein